MGWKYQGANVQVPQTADIPPQFWYGRSLGEIVQRMLDMVEPWSEGENPIETKRLNGARFNPLVVPLGKKKPWWGIHAGHHARRPDASPFIQVAPAKLVRTDLFTIELVQTSERPRLVRAYPGDYIPPLPWMNSASSAPGGVERSVRFWRTHAYVYQRSLMQSRRSQAPNWYRG